MQTLEAEVPRGAGGLLCQRRKSVPEVAARHDAGMMSELGCLIHLTIDGFDGQCDAVSLDWHIAMKSAREIAGPEKILAGNIDPAVLQHGSSSDIYCAVKMCIEQAGNSKHILNLGHGVELDTPEESVRLFVDAARSISLQREKPS